MEKMVKGMLETDRLILLLLDEQDEEEIVRWRNQKEIIDSIFSSGGITLKEHREWYEKYSKGNSRIEFIMKLKKDSIKIGTIGLSNIDPINQKAEYGILIGEKEQHGKGLGYEASCAILTYGFNKLNLHKIYLKCFSDNAHALKLYCKIGFNEEGLLKRDVYKNGEFRDVTLMSIFREEWKM